MAAPTATPSKDTTAGQPKLGKSEIPADRALLTAAALWYMVGQAMIFCLAR
jgi:hypothetical protein